MGQDYYGGWTEKSYEFLGSIPHIENSGGYFDYIIKTKWGGLENEKFSWVRQPQNLKIVYYTVCKIGFEKFVSKSGYDSPMNFKDSFGGMSPHEWEGMTLSQVVDSLLVTYIAKDDTPSYFVKFWTRRKAEKNDELVYSILNKIKTTYSSEPMKTVVKESNDTIESLLKFDLRLQQYNNNPTKDFLTEYFNFLRSIGLNHSAYNLLQDRFPNNFDLDSINKVLNLRIVNEDEYRRTRNSGLWIVSYKDDGP